MKIFFYTLLFTLISLLTIAQSVKIEPGKSIFEQNTTESVEIKSTSAFPLTLRSTQPASGLPFYSNTNMFRGHIQGGVGGLIYSSPANHGHSFWTKNQSRMTIDSLGNVGIGVGQPTNLLHLGSLSFTKLLLEDGGGYGSGIIKFKDIGTIGQSNSLIYGFFNLDITSENNIILKSGANVGQRIESNGNTTINPKVVTVQVGFNSFSSVLPSKANLDVNNTIRSAEIDFEETNSAERRPVFADKDGILRVESSSNHYASYNFSSVFPQNSSDEYTKGSGFAYFNTTNAQKTFYLPVNLPDGVKITNVRMFLLDNSTSNLAFNVNKNSHLTNTFTPIASAQSSTNTTNVFSINDNANETVDNQNNSYYVNISSSGNWTGNTLQFHSLVITYQYQ